MLQQETLISQVKNSSLREKVQGFSNKQLLMESKKLSSSLSELVKLYSSEDQQLKGKIERLIDTVNTLVQEFSDMNNYSYLKNVLKEFQMQTGRKPQVIHVKFRREEAGWDKRREYELNEEEINNEIRNILDENTILPDSENFCCSQLLYRGWNLSQWNSNRKIMTVDYSKLLQEGELQKIICAGLNLGGAYILTGIKDQTQIVGNFISEEEKEKIKEKFLSCIEFITPKIQQPLEIKLDFVPVFEYKQQHKEGLYIVRIKANPNCRITYFIQIERKGCMTVCSVFTWSNKSYYQVQNDQVYTFMLQKWKKNFKKAKFHPFNQCKIPIKSNFLFEQQSVSLLKSNFLFEQQSVSLLKSDYIPSFQKQNQSILLIDSEDKMRLIQDFTKELNAYKYKFHVEQSYPEFWLNSFKKIFLISHDPPFEQINECRIRIGAKKKLPFFSLSNRLKIDDVTNTFNEQLSLFEKVYEKKFGQLFSRDKEGKKIILQFSQMEQALFSFCFLENLNISASFIIDQ